MNIVKNAHLNDNDIRASIDIKSPTQTFHLAQFAQGKNCPEHINELSEHYLKTYILDSPYLS